MLQKASACIFGFFKVKVHAHLPQLFELHLQLLRHGASYQDLAGGGGEHYKGAGFDAVRGDRVLDQAQLFDTIDHYLADPHARNMGATSFKKRTRARYLWLAGPRSLWW